MFVSLHNLNVASKFEFCPIGCSLNTAKVLELIMYSKYFKVNQTNRWNSSNILLKPKRSLPITSSSRNSWPIYWLLFGWIRGGLHSQLSLHLTCDLLDYQRSSSLRPVQSDQLPGIRRNEGVPRKVRFGGHHRVRQVIQQELPGGSVGDWFQALHNHQAVWKRILGIVHENGSTCTVALIANWKTVCVGKSLMESKSSNKHLQWVTLWISCKLL